MPPSHTDLPARASATGLLPHGTSRPEDAMALPNFVGIGAQRAATTWIHNCLMDHPDVYVPATKELSYFDLHFERGPEWYGAHFEGRAGQKAVGEVTPNYMYRDEAIRRMAEVIPDARLFMVLREPVSRAYSAYQLHPQHFRGQSFAEACAGSDDYLVGWSLYADRLATIYEHFDRDRVKVFLYEDIKETPGAMLADLFGFLGVDPTFRPPAAAKIANHAVFPAAQRVLGRMGLGWSIDLVKRTPLGDVVKNFHKSQDIKEKVDVRSLCPSDVRARFRDDVDRLEEMIGRDLSRWKA